MKWWALHIFAGISFILLGWTCVEWVRSYFISEMIQFTQWNQIQCPLIVSDHGTLVIQYTGEQDPDTSVRVSISSQWREGQLGNLENYPKSAEKQWHLPGISWYCIAAAGTVRPHGVVRALVISYWLPALLFAILPALWLFAFSRRQRALHRRAQGLCGRCGYDLRATSGDVCPECGAARAARG